MAEVASQPDTAAQPAQSTQHEQERPAPKPLETEQRNRLLRYLHTGQELPKYYPGCWDSQKYFEADKLPVLDSDVVKNCYLDIIDIVLKTYKDGKYTRFETIAFAFAKCLLVGDCHVKGFIYKAVVQICNTAEEMILFNNFVERLKTGYGRGWCNVIRTWYLKKNVMDLVQEVTRVRGRYGCSHRTLIRKCHLKIQQEDRPRDAIVKYVIYGLKRTKGMMTNLEGTQDIFAYIEQVEALRHCEHPASAAKMITQNNFSIEHVPAHLLTSQEVWDVVLPHFSLGQILYNIQRIHNMGFLTNDSTTTAILVSLLSSQDLIRKSDISPLTVYITLNNYKKKDRPLKHQKAVIVQEREKRRRLRQIFDPMTNQWEWTATRRHPKEIKFWGIDKPPCMEVIDALIKLVDLTWHISPATGLRYMITMDMRDHMFKGRHFCKKYVIPKESKKFKTTTKASGEGVVPVGKKRPLAECFYNRYVTPGHAAIILALQILKREKNVRLALFNEESVQLISLDRNKTDISEAERVLREANQGRVQLDSPIEWANQNGFKIDVFINMIDRPSRYMELELNRRGGRGPGGLYGPPPPPTKNLVDHCPVRALERYRAKVGLKETKLITLALGTHRAMSTIGDHEGVLDIVGVDDFTPKVIDAFATGKFK